MVGKLWAENEAPIGAAGRKNANQFDDQFFLMYVCTVPEDQLETSWSGTVPLRPLLKAGE
jgi:hypothetical protein